MNCSPTIVTLSEFPPVVNNGDVKLTVMPTVPGIYHRSFTLHHLASAARGGACSLLRKEAASVRYQPAAKNAPPSVHHKSPLPHVGAGFIPPDPDFLERLLKSQTAGEALRLPKGPRPTTLMLLLTQLYRL